MKKILLAILLIVGYQSQAQNSNQVAAAEAAKKGYFGYITHPIEGDKWLNINYTITPKVLKNELNYMFHTPYAEPVTFSILDKNGEVIMKWSEQQDEYIKKGKLDVSSLTKGIYTIVIYHKGKEAKRIQITKD